MSFFTSRRQADGDDAETIEKSSHIGFDTVLSATTILDGTLTSTGNIRLDGKFTGKLNITGNVLIGETAEINADIEARNISIAGKVRGNVTGNKVQLLRTGRIWGDIQAQSLTTEEGAFIEGKIAMHNAPIIEDPEPEDIDEDNSEDVEADTIAELPEDDETATIASPENMVDDDDDDTQEDNT